MTLQQLKYVVTVAEKGSMSEAAHSLFVAQPSLTKAIRELEKEINLTIFYRTNRGVVITNEGSEFLGYAGQVLQQANLLEEKYLSGKSPKRRFSVSTQHYSFAVNAFVDIIKRYGNKSYDFTLRETQTHEIIGDVSTLKSEVGILYLSDENEAVMSRLINQSGLLFKQLYTAKPHVFISSGNPLAAKSEVTLDDLKPYPFLSFEQGEYNSFYFSEEILSTVEREMTIKVSDRATLFNLLVGLDGYTVCTGIISRKLNGENIIARPLAVDEFIRIGAVTRRGLKLSELAEAYLEAVEYHLNRPQIDCSC